MYIGHHVKFPLFLSDFNETEQIKKNTQLSNFTKICPVATGLFYADGEIDLTKPIVTFCNFANSSKNRFHLPGIEPTFSVV